MAIEDDVIAYNRVLDALKVLEAESYAKDARIVELTELYEGAQAEVISRGLNLQESGREVASLREQLAILTGRMFPIQDGPAIPWHIIAPHERQAQRNHDQTLQRLAERGGLGIMEAYYVLRDEPLRHPFIDDATAKVFVKQFVESDVVRQLMDAELTIDAYAAKVKALAPHDTCGCSIDTPTDICLHHSPQLAAAQAAHAETQRQLSRQLDVTTQQRENLEAAQAEVERLTKENGLVSARANAEAQLACDLRSSQDEVIERCAKAVECDWPLAAVRLRRHCGDSETTAVSGEDFGELRRANSELTRKGKELCCVYGNALVQIHDLEARERKLHDLISYLIEFFAAVQDVLGALARDLNYIPTQQAWSNKLTDASVQAARSIEDIQAVIRAAEAALKPEETK